MLRALQLPGGEVQAEFVALQGVPDTIQESKPRGGVGLRDLGVWEFRGLGVRGLEFRGLRGLGFREFGG